jgi:hypothetical protein
LVAALSIGSDLGTHREHGGTRPGGRCRRRIAAPPRARSTCIRRRAGARIGELAGASAGDLADTYYVYLVDPTTPEELLEFYRANVGVGRSPEVRARMVEEGIANAGPRARDAFATMCEVAQRFASWLGLRESIPVALEYVFARWDGRGLPNLTGEEIPLPARLLHVARDASLFLSAFGAERARSVLEDRSGAAYDPRLAELAAGNLDEVLAELDEARMWEHALQCEPSPPVWLSGEGINAAFGTIAAITGLKFPWLREHPTGVAELAEAAAWRLQLPEDSITTLRRAALAHDLGRVGVSNAIWEKPGSLAFGEWERVRLHAHCTERAFAQSPALADIGRLAGSHHECGAPLKAALVYTADDEIFEPAWQRFMANELLSTEPIELPGGHFPMLERPFALAELLDRLVGT